jgi:CubicO group peptidase (beta-lactamase class C family)
MKIVNLLFVTVILFFTRVQSQQLSIFEPIEKETDQEIAKGTIPSLVVAVARDGKIIFEKAFGLADIRDSVKTAVNTSYQLASTSKTLTATGVMVLNRKGKVNVDSSAEKYIKPLRFKAYEGKGADVTLKHLLNHTSGLGTYFNITYEDESIKPSSFADVFNRYGILVHPPSTVCEYSNLGYGLLDYIIANQSGLSFAEFMEREVFTPLGMTHSFVDSTSQTSITIAKKYDSQLREIPQLHNDTPGAGNVYSSIHDLILFGMFHLKDKVPGQKKILDDEIIDLMQSYRDKKALYHYYGSFYGLGWYYQPNDQGYKIVWHEGGATGMSSLLELIPSENIAVAVITNTSNNAICRKIKNDILKILLPKYNPGPFDEISDYKKFVADSSFWGIWKGTIYVGDWQIPLSINFQKDGDIIAEYLDFTFASYYTQGNPIPHKTVLLSAFINKNSFIGMFPGILPANGIRRAYSHFMNLKLICQGNKLTGTIVAIPASEREYYAYPYYVQLEKEKQN